MGLDRTRHLPMSSDVKSRLSSRVDANVCSLASVSNIGQIIVSCSLDPEGCTHGVATIKHWPNIGPAAGNVGPMFDCVMWTMPHDIQTLGQHCLSLRQCWANVCRSQSEAINIGPNIASLLPNVGPMFVGANVHVKKANVAH